MKLLLTLVVVIVSMPLLPGCSRQPTSEEISARQTAETTALLERLIVPKFEVQDVGLEQAFTRALELAGPEGQLERVRFYLPINGPAKDETLTVTMSLINISLKELLTYISNLANLEMTIQPDRVVFYSLN
jgi:hypothetical protein